MAQMAGTVTAQWYDPTANSYSPVSGSPFANAGMHNFTPPGNNAVGYPDWVFVLKAHVPDSPPVITAATWKADGFHLTFYSILGRQYQIDFSQGLPALGWSNLVNQVPGTGEPVGVTDPASNAPPGRFYRVGLLPGG